MIRIEAFLPYDEETARSIISNGKGIIQKLIKCFQKKNSLKTWNLQKKYISLHC